MIGSTVEFVLNCYKQGKSSAQKMAIGRCVGEYLGSERIEGVVSQCTFFLVQVDEDGRVCHVKGDEIRSVSLPSVLKKKNKAKKPKIIKGLESIQQFEKALLEYLMGKTEWGWGMVGFKSEPIAVVDREPYLKQIASEILNIVFEHNAIRDSINDFTLRNEYERRLKIYLRNETSLFTLASGQNVIGFDTPPVNSEEVNGYLHDISREIVDHLIEK